ncbi:MAG: cation transporter, partial [Eubacteriales bacterium]
MNEKKYTISGITCASCQSSVERAISSLNGVDSVSVSLLSNSATVSFDENAVSDETIFAAVRQAGYSASAFEKREVTEENEQLRYRAMVRRLIASAVLAIIMMYVTMGHMIHLPVPSFMDPHGMAYEPLIYAAVQFALAVPVIIINRAYFTDGFRGALSGSPNMNTLVATGAAASMIYGIYIFVRMLIGYRAGEMIHGYSEEL